MMASHPLAWKRVQGCVDTASNLKLQLLEWTGSSIHRDGTD